MQSFNHLEKWFLDEQNYVNNTIKKYLPDSNKEDKLLNTAINYVLANKGKRMRPLLCIATSKLGNTNKLLLEQFFVALELIHNYSLVHDDMPLMDNDDLRHGKPSCHIKFNEVTALLTGDALQSLAFEIISINIDNKYLEKQMRATNYLAKAIGSNGMAGGQSIDLQNEKKSITLDELKLMHSLKTGKLINAAIFLGYLSCDDYKEKNLFLLNELSNDIGLAFQVIDDVLDKIGSTDTLGKTSGKDEINLKPNFVSYLGLREAKNYANILIEKVKDKLFLNFGSKSDYLIYLCDTILSRSY